MDSLLPILGTQWLNLLCLFVLLFIVFLNRRSLFNPDATSGTGFFALWLVMTLYCMFYAPPAGDNFSSIETYISYKSGVAEEYLHLEPIYFRIMDIVPSYLAWRCVIWGSGCLLLVLLLKRMKLDAHIATIVVLYFCMKLLYYQRACPAYVLLYWAMFLFVEFDKSISRINFKKLYPLMAIGLLYLTLSFHTTMPFYVLMTVAAVLVPKSRSWAVISLLGVAVVSALLPYVISGFLEHVSEETVQTAELYLSIAKKGDAANALGLFVQIVTQSPFYIMLVYFLWNIDSAKFEYTKMEKCLLMNVLFLITAGIVMASMSVTIRAKFFVAAQLPWGLFLASLYTRKRTERPLPLFVKLLFWVWLFGLAVSVTSGSILNGNRF